MVLNDFSLKIDDGDFVVLIGPSGCGKTTILNIIAGLECPTTGNVYIDDALSNSVEPKDRDVAMVFQNHALYPHLSVYKNLAFPLKLRKHSKKDIEKEVFFIANLLNITELLNRKPNQLSGGQQQRVAIGKALIRNPSLFLMDVTIEIIELGQDDLVQKLNIALSSGKKDSLPDIVCEEDYNLKSYISYYKDCFVDLTDHVNKDNYVDFKVKNCTVDGRIWAIPYDTGVSAWFYRYDILKEAGYEEKDLENITWSQFIEIGRKVLDKTGKYLIPLVPEGNIEGRVILQSANSWYYDAEGNLDISQNNALADMSKVIKDIYNSGVVDKVSSCNTFYPAYHSLL